MPRKFALKPDNPEQCRRFLKAAREVGAAELGETFDRVLGSSSAVKARCGETGEETRGVLMQALLTLGIYATPFVLIGVAARYWMARRSVRLSDVQAEGDPARSRSRFLLGIWRHEQQDGADFKLRHYPLWVLVAYVAAGG